MLRIEITDPTEADARALIALFREQFPAITNTHGPAVFNTVAVTGAPEKIASGIAALHSATPAPDGYPVEETDETTEPTTQTAEPVERDADGIAWDERIHTSNKSTKQDGTWKRKPGVDDAVFNAVLAELKAANTARTIAAAAPLTAPEADTSAADAFGGAPQPPVTAATPPPPPPVAAAAPPPVAAAAPPPPAATTAPSSGNAPSFVQIMQKVTAAQQAGKFDKAAFDGALAACGLENVGKLVAADDGVRAAFDALVPA